MRTDVFDSVDSSDDDLSIASVGKLVVWKSASIDLIAY